MNIKPLKFQQKAIAELRKAINTLWLKDGRTQIILHSPTSSGKTFMTCALIDSLQDITPEDVNLGDVAYFWITMNNELAMQSKKKFEQYFTPNLRNTLSSFDDCNNTLRQNEVLFANWQKLAQKKVKTACCFVGQMMRHSKKSRDSILKISPRIPKKQVAK